MNPVLIEDGTEYPRSIPKPGMRLSIKLMTSLKKLNTPSNTILQRFTLAYFCCFSGHEV